MSCTTVDEPLRLLLDTLAEQDQLPTNQLDTDAVTLALSYGWVYQHAGRIALTGAGAYHSGQERRKGMLG